MCTNSPSIPKTKPTQPAMTVDESSSSARDQQQRRMLLARGLESTWTRSSYGDAVAGGGGAGAGSKAVNLGGTK